MLVGQIRMKRNINYSFDGKEKDKKAENNIIAALKSKYGDRFFESDLLNKTTKETRTGGLLELLQKMSTMTKAYKMNITLHILSLQ